MFNHTAILQQCQGQQQTLRKLPHKDNAETMKKSGSEPKLKQAWDTSELVEDLRQVCTSPCIAFIPASFIYPQHNGLPVDLSACKEELTCIWFTNHSLINSQQSFWASLCGCGSSRCYPGLTRCLSSRPRVLSPTSIGQGMDLPGLGRNKVGGKGKQFQK